MAEELDIGPGCRCLDLGCGIGGPASTIEAFTQARITGVNCSFVQLRLLKRSLRRRRIDAVRADFAELPFARDVFDRAYSFEALCHAVDIEAAFREIHRILRPGGRLGFSEWCLTEEFDPDDTSHDALRRTIEASYGIAALRRWSEWQTALLKAGFRTVELVDRARPDDRDRDQEPWYRALLPRDRTLDSLGRGSRIRALQSAALSFAERCRLAPRGTAATVRQLREGTVALIEAGRLRIFTPMMFAVAVKDSVGGQAEAAKRAIHGERQEVR